jgi:hypothetical protein
MLCASSNSQMQVETMIHYYWHRIFKFNLKLWFQRIMLVQWSDDQNVSKHCFDKWRRVKIKKLFKTLNRAIFSHDCIYNSNGYNKGIFKVLCKKLWIIQVYDCCYVLDFRTEVRYPDWLLNKTKQSEVHTWRVEQLYLLWVSYILWSLWGRVSELSR